MKIVLASSSARRKQILRKLVDNFDVFVSCFQEDNITFDGDCGSYVMNVAAGKAMDVSSKISGKDVIVIGCDTIVYFHGKIFGKPKDENEAFHMLKSLSGNEHQVYSGIAVIDKSSNNIKSDFVKTNVRFSDISDKQIEKYLKIGEYSDKAGAYGIQGYGGVFVQQIHGCYYNVVGLPLNRLYKMLSEMGVNLKL